jgi:hypothetical protein
MLWLLYGPLSRVPFGALVSENEVRAKYAIEEFNLAVVPSLYLLDLVLK